MFILTKKQALQTKQAKSFSFNSQQFLQQHTNSQCLSPSLLNKAKRYSVRKRNWRLVVASHKCCKYAEHSLHTIYNVFLVMWFIHNLTNNF